MSRASRLEIRNDDGTTTICELEITPAAISARPVAAPTDTPAPSPLDLPADRYEIEAVVGRGGFADVVRAVDRKLGRVVALKVPRRAEASLRAEAALAATLQHPNIVPVYDTDVANGRPYYSMKLLTGASLRDVIAELASSNAAAGLAYPLPRLLEAFRQICLAVEYAHDEGVLHRDIKPANILLGEYGEVVLTDWGIARFRDFIAPEEAGLLRGTLAYMAPEMFRDTPHGSIATDVYALGATLYELIAHRPPRQGSLEAILAAIRDGEPPPPSAVRAGVPPALEAICVAAMAARPEDRPGSAASLARQVAEYLDAERDEAARRERAEQAFGLARRALTTYREQCDAAAAAAADVARKAETTAHDAPIATRRLLWEREAHREASLVARELAFGDAVSRLQQVLVDDPGHLLARAGLSELYWERLRDAEAARDPVGAARFAQLVRHVDPGGARRLAAKTRVTIECETPDFRVDLWEFQRVGPILERHVRVRDAGATFDVPPGNYCAQLSAPGHVSMWVPFLADREEKLRLRRRLYRDAEVAPGLVVVSGGAMGDFAMGRYPVTVEEYLRYVNAIGDDAGERLPGGADSPYFERRDGAWALRPVDADGDAWDPRWPMLMLPRHDAEAYVTWFAQATGLPVCLPSKTEWEWSATGPDGRAFPWGDQASPGCACLRTIADARAMPRPVGTFFHDESAFGICDLGGGVSEWTRSAHGDSGILKGGSFITPPDNARNVLDRFARPYEAYPHYGMRVAQPL